MLTQPQVQRYSNESGLRDIMIAEKEVVLTFLLQLLSERGILDRLAFKGGTCLRKMFIGSAGPVFDRSGFHGNRGARSRGNDPRHDGRRSSSPITESSSPFRTIAITKRRMACPGASIRHIPMTGIRAAAKSSCRSAAAKRRRCRRSGGRRSSRVISGSCRSRRLKSSALRSRNPCRENPRLLSAEQGARHLRPRNVRHAAARPGTASAALSC